MPELPEVETTRRGIAPYILHRQVTAVIVRQPKLRWPVPEELPRRLQGARIDGVERRAKYLLLRTGGGTAILHLGMSGSLRMVDTAQPAGPHDHVDLCFKGGRCLRLTDPRRFGALLWSSDDPLAHPLLAALGPEPLGPDFNGDHLFTLARGRRSTVKQFTMDGKVVAGVGNIYANESLFLAGIHPRRPAGRISRERYSTLAESIKAVLASAIAQGGTTLRDFVGSDGRPGYFAQSLNVYGREGEACPRCGSAIREERLGQRSTYYCARCQR